MRRVALIVLTLAVAGVFAVVLAGSRAQGSSSSRFDVIFDDARGLIPGQLVKIAGARAGTIQNVGVTPDFKARIEATVDSRFMPFHRDATCTIRPEGLIAENYIDCDPGSINSPPLRSVGNRPPTVPVTHTTEPVSLLDLFNIFNLPTRERLTVIINELGIATSGRGTNINDILRRANPALAQARQVISILDNQQRQLATIVDASSTIAAQGAAHTADIQRFLDKTAAFTTLTAAHKDALSQTIARLPGLLAATQPALQQLDVIAREGTPLVQQLGASVPALNRVESDFGPFVAAAKPALSQLSKTLTKVTPEISAATPLVTSLNNYVNESLPSSLEFEKLMSNLQQHGFIENFLSVAYHIAASLARFDGNSHLLSIYLVGPNNNLCSAYATKPVPGCSAHYGSQPPYKPVSAIADRRTPPRASHCSGKPRHCAQGASDGSRGLHDASVSAPRPVARAEAGNAPPGSGKPDQPIQNLVEYLLK
jgi:virulence factor Mce-like protein